MRKNFLTILCGVAVIVFLAVKMVGVSMVHNENEGEEPPPANIVEGAFYDRDGDLIFAPEKPYVEDTTEMKPAYSYLLGYNDRIYGSSGLRELYRDHLYDDKKTGRGGDIYLTIDDILQEKAYSYLQTRDLSGSIVVLNARNAEILAMAGRRDKDYVASNMSADKMEKYNEIDGFLVQPATGDYKAPGSVFKVITSAAAIMHGKKDFVYNDTEELVVDGKTIRNADSVPHGTEDLQTAFINSTNTYFASLSLELGERAMKSVLNDFLVGENIDLGFAKLKSSAEVTGSDHNLAMIGFGQGGVAISPLHIAMIGQSIVNRGRMVQPTIVKNMYNAKGKEIFRNTEHTLLTNTVKSDVADEVKVIMKGLVDKKYPDWAQYSENIYAKTGTAQPVDNAKIYNSYFLCMTEEYVILVSINNTSNYGGEFSFIAENLLRELY